MLIVDTGVLVATADRSDPDHAVCRSLLEDDDGPLVATGLAVAEAAYLIDRQVGPDGEVALYRPILDRVLIVESRVASDWHRVRDLVDRYRDLGLGGTDASLIAVAERLRAGRVATLDRRHLASSVPTTSPASNSCRSLRDPVDDARDRCALRLAITPTADELFVVFAIED